MAQNLSDGSTAFYYNEASGLGGLYSATWAWFNGSVASSDNEIKAGDSASGYCVITDARGNKYRTDYIQRHSGDMVKISVILTVVEAQTVSFETYWGIYSDESSANNGRIIVPAEK